VSKITKSIPIPVFYAFQNKPNYKPHSWGNPTSNSKKEKHQSTPKTPPNLIPMTKSLTIPVFYKFKNKPVLLQLINPP